MRPESVGDVGSFAGFRGEEKAVGAAGNISDGLSLGVIKDQALL